MSIVSCLVVLTATSWCGLKHSVDLAPEKVVCRGGGGGEEEEGRDLFWPCFLVGGFGTIYLLAHLVSRHPRRAR